MDQESVCRKTSARPLLFGRADGGRLLHVPRRLRRRIDPQGVGLHMPPLLHRKTAESNIEVG